MKNNTKQNIVSKGTPLTIFERITIPSILPEKGNFEQALVSQDLTNKIRFSQEELKDYKIKTEEENGFSVVRWDDRKDGIVKYIDLTELEADLIMSGFEKMSDTNTVPLKEERIINLYRKIKALSSKGKE